MSSKRREVLGFNDTWLTLIGIPIIAIMVNAILFGEYSLLRPKTHFASCQLIALLYTTIYWLLFRQGHYFLLMKYPHPGNNFQRFLAIGSMTVFGYFAVNGVLDYFCKPYFPKDFEPDPIIEIVSAFLFFALVIGTYEGLHLSHKLRASILERERLVKENINSQLQGLRSQVNPHFLFNSLNTLASIIPEDADKGVNFVTKLSKVYRYMLESRNEKLIPLHEELEFLNAYNYLIKQRFGENIRIELRLDDKLKGKLIIPLSLQITFENAIKHNIISKDRPLLIEVFIDENEKLVVRNTLQKKSIAGSSTKFGLQNIKNRYAFYTNETVDIIATHEHFSVMLPLINRQQLLAQDA